MEYFKKYFSDVEQNEWGAEEVKVLCPFHSDTRPSASINTHKNLFHCWVCNIGYNPGECLRLVKKITEYELRKFDF